jgi:DNA-directed RNA polymerase subunit RPC12/RpoP
MIYLILIALIFFISITYAITKCVKYKKQDKRLKIRMETLDKESKINKTIKDSVTRQVNEIMENTTNPPCPYCGSKRVTQLINHSVGVPKSQIYKGQRIYQYRCQICMNKFYS